MCSMWPALHVAQEMGVVLGGGPVVQRKVQIRRQRAAKTPQRWRRRHGHSPQLMLSLDAGLNLLMHLLV